MQRLCQQPIAGGLALVGTTDQRGNDMRFCRHDRQPGRAKCGLCLGDAILVCSRSQFTTFSDLKSRRLQPHKSPVEER